jgi:hypothetical protein
VRIFLQNKGYLMLSSIRVYKSDVFLSRKACHLHASIKECSEPVTIQQPVIPAPVALAKEAQIQQTAVTKCATGSHQLPGSMVIDFEEVRKFSNEPLERVRGFTIEEYEKYMMAPAGKEHYALLNYISNTYGDCRHITDIGTRYVSSALALSSNLKTPVWTFDLPSSNERQAAFRGKSESEWQSELRAVGANITFYNVDLMQVSDDEFKKFIGTWFVMLDTHHRPYTKPFEREFFKRVLETGFKGLLLLDDINEHDEMRRWWTEVQDAAAASGYRAYSLSPVGHWSGTGLVDFSGKLVVRDGSTPIEPLSPVLPSAPYSPMVVVSCDSNPCQGIFAYAGPNTDTTNSLEVMTKAIASYNYGNERNSATENKMIFMPTKTDPHSCVEEWKSSRPNWVDR